MFLRRWKFTFCARPHVMFLNVLTSPSLSFLTSLMIIILAILFCTSLNSTTATIAITVLLALFCLALNHSLIRSFCIFARAPLYILSYILQQLLLFATFRSFTASLYLYTYNTIATTTLTEKKRRSKIQYSSFPPLCALH